MGNQTYSTKMGQTKTMTERGPPEQYHIHTAHLNNVPESLLVSQFYSLAHQLEGFILHQALPIDDLPCTLHATDMALHLLLLFPCHPDRSATAICGSTPSEGQTLLVANTTCIAQSAWTIGTTSPLWRLTGSTVSADYPGGTPSSTCKSIFPACHSSAWLGIATVTGSL